jgi:hypothetical protein
LRIPFYRIFILNHGINVCCFDSRQIIKLRTLVGILLS